MVVIDESRHWLEYHKLELIEFNILMCLLTRHYFLNDIGSREKEIERDPVEYEAYKLEVLRSETFCGEWLIFILRKVMKIILVNVNDFEDVKK